MDQNSNLDLSGDPFEFSYIFFKISSLSTSLVKDLISSWFFMVISRPKGWFPKFANGINIINLLFMLQLSNKLRYEQFKHLKITVRTLFLKRYLRKCLYLNWLKSNDIQCKFMIFIPFTTFGNQPLCCQITALIKEEKWNIEGHKKKGGHL